MTQVFISYSRADIEFVRRLHEALEARAYEAWVDWEGIPPSDKWMARIHGAIDAAEAFIFVISPQSIVSDVCGEELDYAVQQHKKLIPVLLHEPGVPVPQVLAEINYIFARDDNDFTGAVDTLTEAIDTDLDWVRGHTRLLIRAVEWHRSGRERSLTLRGRDLIEFEEWTTRAPDKEPKPTVLQSEYLLASRRAVTRSQRITLGGVATGLSIAVVLGTVAWFQNVERDRQANIVSARQLLSQAEGLRDVSEEEQGADAQHSESLRAAAKALAAFDALGEPTFDADLSVRKSLARMAKWTGIKTGSTNQHFSAFDPIGRFVGMVMGPQELSVWSVEDRDLVATCPFDLTGLRSVLEVSTSEAGHRIAAYFEPGSRNKKSSTVVVWSMAECEEILTVDLPNADGNAFKSMALSPDGTTLGLVTKSGLELWDVTRKTAIQVESDARVGLIEANPNGLTFATYEYRKSDRARFIRVRNASSGEALHEVRVPRHPRGRLDWWGTSLLAGNQRIRFDGEAPVLVESFDFKGERLALSQDARRVAIWGGNGTSTGSRSIEIRDVETAALIATSRHRTNITKFIFTEDGNALLSLDPAAREVGIWQFKAPDSYALLRSGPNIREISFAESGNQMVTRGMTGEVLWDLPDPGTGDPPILAEETVKALTLQRKPIGPFYAQTQGPGDLSAVIVEGTSTRGGPNRRLEVLRGDETVARLELKPVLDLDLSKYLQFAGGGRFVVVGTREGLLVLRAETLEQVAVLYHRGVVLAGVASDGKRAVTMASDLSIRVWDISTGLELTRLAAEQPAHMLALSNDGRWLAAAHTEGIISLWALSPDDLIGRACRWFPDPCP